MEKTLIFVGPTLYETELARLPDEIWLPPAGQGDVLKGMLRYNPKQIVLIDGTFYHTLSVWIKELLYVMASGTRVIGASSMGAMRAAELWRYGMIGIGEIFEAYKEGSIQDDAWVAMSYDPETFRPLTDPPCGSKQKRLDALKAIEYARTNHDPCPILISMEELRPLFTGVLDKVLENEVLIYGGR
jgi:hypothetical protein